MYRAFQSGRDALRLADIVAHKWARFLGHRKQTKRRINMTIPTENVGSLPRPADLLYRCDKPAQPNGRNARAGPGRFGDRRQVHS